ncbi:hypothetical protein BDB00DRAFT_933335 [Zychaea mexicana]|uniref:uncharacterized protein n=1 Tax=Zychaea mexicana TaxID=64656 RepID=UPI0022FECAE8|nr:uncharacterized protein BDB00DRAFT_933335 [Zychaea mexicana]KAI9484908.1 hypothetical protein BDB00DRAFT_933335 [Zychaea mexicana]
MPKRKHSDEPPPNDTKRLATTPTQVASRLDLRYCMPGNVARSTFDKCSADLGRSDFQGAITGATSTIDDLHDSLIALLDIRAISYSRTMQFDKAFQDASLMIRYAPLRAAGYLRTAELYLLQCRQLAAMRISQQGIKSVPTDRYDEQKQLQDCYNAAKTRQEKRINFITKLPYDLLCQVMDHLPIYNLAQALQVCRDWRDRMSVYPKPWASIYLMESGIGCSEKGDEINSVMNVLPHVSRNVEKIHITCLESEQCEKLFSMIIKGTFNRLQRLQLAICTTSNYCRFMLALWQTKDTLQELCIVTVDENSPVAPIGVILSTCRNLQRLECRQHRITATADGIGAVSTSRPSSLLELDLAFAQIDTAVLAPILRCCRKVRKLNIHSCQIEAIDLMRAFCPDVKSFTINVTAHDTPSTEEDNQHIISSSSASKRTTEPSMGLTHIMMHLTQERTADKPIRLLTDNSNTLNNLSLTLPIDNIPNLVQHWSPLRSLVFSKLIRLDVTFGVVLSDVVATVIRHGCPILEELFIGNTESISLDIFQAISQLRRLKDLKLAEIPYVNEQGMIQMFESFAGRQQGQERACTLRAIELSGSEFEVSDAILQALADIPSLERIYMSELTTMDRYAFDRFARKLRERSPPIHTLHLSDLECVSEEAIIDLSAVESLRSVELFGLRHVTSQSIEKLYSNKTIALETDVT